MIIISFAKRCARTAIALKQLISNRSYYDSYTYYPEYMDKRKSKFSIFFDQLEHILKYSFCNQFYFLYGFDIKGLRTQSDYVDNDVFMRVRNRLNNSRPSSPISILRDKSFFDIIARQYRIRTPNVLGVINKEKVLYDYKKGISIPFTKYMEENVFDAFLKVSDGECAEGIFHIICNKKYLIYHNQHYSFSEFLDNLPLRSSYILQEKMPKQHHLISAIYDKAINTIRLVTVISPKTQKPMPFTAVLRVGVGDNEVDNWASGGLSIGVDLDNSCLKKYGYFKPGYGTKTEKHPNSKIIFEGYKIPFLGDAVTRACRFHEILNGIHSIGWDIAITEDGPCFIEGNDNWEISLMQISNHGLQREFDKLFHN